jgi:hypothetical protein
MNNSDENNLRINKKKKEEVKEDKPKQAKKVDRKKFEKQETTTRVKQNMQTSEADSSPIYNGLA